MKHALAGTIALRVTAVLLCLILLPAVTPAQTAPSSSPSPKVPAATPDSGSVHDGTYHNAFFGFVCKIPYGWVLRTKEMASDDGKSQGTVLLAAFQRPPEANEKTVNPTMMVAAEPLTNYPGIKQAADYFDPLTEVAKNKGFTVVNEPYAFPVGPHQLVRSDFRKQNENVSAFQSSLVMFARGYVVSFTFIAESEDDADELVENLSFVPAKRAPSAK